MWKSEQLGVAAWQDFFFDVRGGNDGIGVVDADSATRNPFHIPGRLVSLAPVDQPTLPVAAEQFVRGDAWNVLYPQGDGIYELRVVYRPIECRDDQLVLEMTISIQTDRLDTHPKIDLDVHCQSINSIVPGDLSGDDEVAGTGSAPISTAAGPTYSTSVLLGPHDAPFTTNLSTDSLLRLRLFGEFLEKGVIRKARPWIVIRRGAEAPAEAELLAYWNRLCASPLPLTA